MADLAFPITKVEGDKLQIVVDMALYSKESLSATCYKYTDRFYIHQQSSDNSIIVLFESKNGSNVTDDIVKCFCNDLIDQQVRYNTNLQFGHIRDLIVEEAFKPIS